MPLIDKKPREMKDGSLVTTYTDTVGTSYVTYTLEKEQELIKIRNRGLKSIFYSVGSFVGIEVKPGEEKTTTVNFTSFQVKSAEGIQQFEVWADEVGSTLPGGSDPLLVEKVNEVTAQLAQKAQKDEVRLNTVKLGQNDMTEEFLQQMAGTTPINSIPQDKSVTPAKTTFFKYGKNLLNKIDPDVLLGAYYNSSNVLTTNAGYNQSGFISVEAGQNYTASYKQNIVNWYDIDKNFLSSTPSATFSSQGYVTAPTGAYYARFMSPVANWETLQVEKGMASTPYETYKVSIDSQFLPSSSVNVLKDKRFTSFGDSITAQGMWQSYVKDYFSLIHTNLGIGSTTVAYVADRETTYPCFTNASRIQAIKDSNPDIITILGGTNDAHLLTPVGTTPSISRDITRLDKTTFKGGYAFLIETLLTWKPTLEIVMLSPMQSGYMTNPYSTYVNAAKEIADFYALPFVDLYKESGISYYNINTYTSDSLHPNAVGGKRIANMTIDKFKMIGTV